MVYTTNAGNASTAEYIVRGVDIAYSRLMLATRNGAEIDTASAVRDPTEGAQALLALGKNVPVSVVAQYGCDNTDDISATIDNFGISLVQPVTMSTAVPTESSFSDNLQLGDTIKVSQLVTLTGWGKTGVILNNGVATTATADLTEWFGVTDVVWDLANAVTNLTINSNNGIEVPTISTPSSTCTPKWCAVHALAKYTLHTIPGTITAVSNTINTPASVLYIHSLTQVAKSFHVAIPVYAVTKCNTHLFDANQAMVVFTIAPAENN